MRQPGRDGAPVESATCAFTNAVPGLCTGNTDGDASLDCADADDDSGLVL